MIARNADWGESAATGVSRLDVIVGAYGPLAAAVSANDAAATAEKERFFAETIHRNALFESCWETALGTQPKGTRPAPRALALLGKSLALHPIIGACKNYGGVVVVDDCTIRLRRPARFLARSLKYLC